MAGERCVSELCGGAGGVPDPGEPGPGRGDRRVRAWADAYDWHRLRVGASPGATDADEDVCELGYAGGAVRGVDDHIDSDFAIYGQREDGQSASANGVDSSDVGG